VTCAPAGLAAGPARPGPVRALMLAAVTAVTAAWGTLAVLAWLAGIIIRQSRAARRHRARQSAQPLPRDPARPTLAGTGNSGGP
jgi:hypothetical protein